MYPYYRPPPVASHAARRWPRMTRRRWVALIVIAAVVSLPFLLPAPRRPTAISRENFDRIRDGMTEEEVADILGGPPGMYTDRPDPVFYHGVSFRRWWIGDEAVIVIEVGIDDSQPETWRRVGGKDFWPYPPESLAEWLLRRVGL
jgi:hypothetical protein